MVLTRFAETRDGTLGRLGKWCVLEEPWRQNMPRISCIPTGVFPCRRSLYHKGGYPAFEIVVPDRSRILIHAGNTLVDTEGCPLIGKEFGVLGGKIAVLQSRLALAEFMDSLVGVDEFMLCVVNV